MRPIWSIAERRNIASLFDVSSAYLNALDFSEILEETGALPRSGEWRWLRMKRVAGVKGSGGAAAGGGAAVAAAEGGGGGKSAGAAGATAALAEADEEADPDNLAPSNDIKVKLVMQWNEFVKVVNIPGARRYSETDKSRLPGYYWIRTRVFWPDLSELMLFWLAHPVCTAGLERGFSFQTLIDSDARRRRLTSAHLRDDMLVHLYRDQLEEKLEASL